MVIDKNNLEEILLDYVEQIKILVSPEIWSNVLLDCSKNEILILFLLYRGSDVNMSQIAEYTNVPLNTATGIVSRMEKKQMLIRERNTDDKRIVTIVMTEHGKALMQDILNQFLRYGQQILSSLTAEEMELAGVILDKVGGVLKTEQVKSTTPAVKRIKKIKID